MKTVFSALLITLIIVLLLSLVATPFSAGAFMTQNGDITETHFVSSSSSHEKLGDLNIEGPYRKKGNPRLDSALNDLITNSRTPPVDSLDMNLFSNEESMIRVIVESMRGSENEVAAAVTNAGEIEAEYNGLLQVNLPITRLLDLAEDQRIRFIRQPYQALPAIMSEGASLIGATQWQSAGYNGSGVKIGVLDGGFSGYSALQAQGELPGTINTWWSPSIRGPGNSFHGAACAEIIFDIAPGATYYFANFSGDIEFGEAVDWLISQNVDVISCSMGWPGFGPGDGTGIINQIVDQAYNAGIFWSQSAANSALKHWSGTFVSADGDEWIDFLPGDETNSIIATDGQSIRASLSWNDPWGASANDYDFFLVDNSLNIVSSSVEEQSGTGDPFEFIDYTATYSGTYFFKIAKYDNAVIRNFHLYSYNQDLHYKVAAGSICVPADSPRVMTVGAVPWNSPTTIESFSSQGPNTVGVVKPDIVAPDRVRTVTYGPSGFAGTSASAPCAAGAAALIKGAFPSSSHVELKSYLESHAVDLGAGGKDNVFGSGMLFLANPPGGINFTTVSQSITAGSPSAAITIQIQDSLGNPVNVVSNTDINLESSSLTGKFDSAPGGAFSGAFNQVTVPAGHHSTDFFYKDTTSGTPIITVASAGMSPVTQQETITPGVPSQLRIETTSDGLGIFIEPQNLIAGDNLTAYGIIRDLYNNYIGNPAETVWSLSNKIGGVLDSDLSAASGDNVTLNAHLAGSAVIHAVNGALTADSGIITVVKGPLDHLLIKTQPSSTLSVDSVLNTAAVVAAYDVTNNPLEGITIAADRDPATGTGILRGTLSGVTNSAGFVTFSDLAYNKTDAFKIKFSSGAKTVLSDALGPLPAGVAAVMNITTAPVLGASVDDNFTTQPVIRIADQFDNPKIGTVVTASRGTGSGTLRGILTSTSDASGLAAFTSLGYSKSGETFTVNFNAGNLSANTLSLGPLAVGAPIQLRVENSADGSGVLVGTQNLLAGSSLVVYGVTRDQYNNYVGHPIETEWSLINKIGGVADNDLSAAFGDNVTLNAHLGGSATIHAVNGTLSGDSGTICVSLLPPNEITVSLAPVAGVSVDSPLATQPVILVTDADSNPVSGITITASRGTGTGTLMGTLTAISDVFGLAAFTDLGYNKSGETFTINFTAGNLSVNSDILAALNAGTAASVKVETAANGSGIVVPAQNLTSGDGLTVYSIGRDQYENFVSNIAADNWTLSCMYGAVAAGDLAASADNKSATFTGHGVGAGVIQLVSGSLASTDSGIISVIAGAPASLTMSQLPGTANNVDAIFDIQPWIQVSDVFGNPVAGIPVSASLATGTGVLRSSLTIVSGPEGLVKFIDLGYSKTDAFQLRFTAEGTPGVTANAFGPLTAGIATQIRVETAPNGSGNVVPAQNLTSGNALTVYSIARDQYENFVGNIAADTWTLSNISGGLAAGDLIASVDKKSAIMTGHGIGTGVIQLTSGSLLCTSSGLITIIEQVVNSDGGNSGGNGGGGGGDRTLMTSGLIANSQLMMNSGSTTLNKAVLSTADNKATLEIPAGITILNAQGYPLAVITATAVASPPSAPDNNTLILAYTFGPPGTSFNPAIMLSTPYDPAKLPEGVDETNLYISSYNGTTWVNLESTVDPVTHTVTAQVSHFSVYALLGKKGSAVIAAAVPEATPTPTPAAEPTPVIVPTPVETSLPVPTTNPIPAPSIGPVTSPPSITAQPLTVSPAPTPEPVPAKSNSWMIIIAIIVAVAIITTIVLLFIRSRGSKPKKRVPPTGNKRTN